MNELLIGLLTFAAVCATPGPAVVAVISSAMSRGFRSSFALTLGLASALGVWGVLAAAGFGAVLAAAPSMLIVLKVLGGIYLLWLAWGAGRSAWASRTSDLPQVRSGFRAGLVLNLSNPKSILAWTATIAVGTPPDAPGMAWLLVPLAALVTVMIYVFYGLFFSLPVMRSAYGRMRRWIDGIAAGVFGAAGLGLMSEGVSSALRRS
ncbi:Threonine/homoserine/homoserine lactone efflux protein [Jannaschia faecimaris]|uniref:Threonine/homoserine/homoserine lactone efflux protein n=1 Tax=Jannaschia faecimaris TaxID=1244108 RepID=A0A1H3U0U2_9RHOB|nr:LysE family translocator [Jannaschia faecimaris]SDZ55671.1 Threonine/homoserine/homoserine lactone efflux protein [Jannaschia faecimaris]